MQLQADEKTDERALAARFDYQINPLNKVYFRFFRDQGTDIAPEGVSGRVTRIEAVPQNGVFAYQSVLNNSGSLINEFKIGYNGARTRINGSAPTVNGLDFSNIILNISGSVANTGIAGQGKSSGISIPGGLVRANSATNGRGQPYTPYSIGFIDSLNCHSRQSQFQIRRRSSLDSTLHRPSWAARLIRFPISTLFSPTRPRRFSIWAMFPRRVRLITA